MSWFSSPDLTPDEVATFVRTLAALREVQDAFAAARHDPAVLAAVGEQLRHVAARLAPLHASADDQLSGRVLELPSRGSALVPPVVERLRTPERFEGTVRLGRWAMGSNMAAHGGVIPLVLDEVLGVLAVRRASGRTRTAYLTTQYRAVTPVDRDLDVVAWVESVEGRKLFVRGEIRHEGVLTAESQALFVVLRDGAP